MRISTRRVGIAAALVGLALLLPTSAAGAGEPYPPDGCMLEVSTNIVAPGQVVDVTGRDFPPGPVDLFLLSDPVYLQTVVADANGNFSTQVTIPEGTTPGFHEIRASVGTCAVASGLTVTGATTPGGGNLAFTGSDTVPWAWIGLVLLAVGTAVVVGVRRQASVRQRDAA